MSKILLALAGCVQLFQISYGFSSVSVNESFTQHSIPHLKPTFSKRRPTAIYMDSKNVEGSSKDEDLTSNPIAKASWYAVETFGKLFAPKSVGDKEAEVIDNIDMTKPPKSKKETLERIKLDNDRQYFLSGEVDAEIYDEDCVFSDPFVAFNGRDRFIENLQNLGSFITKYDAKPLSYEIEDDGNVVQTKVMVKLELNLPWKPILAWPWGVRYEIDPETNLVTDHKESWDIGALDGVKQIFRKPTLKI